MIVNSNEIVEFSTNITVPEGFYYNTNNQVSLAVNTDSLNLYVADLSVIPSELPPGYTREVRLTGDLLYTISLNALTSSYNYSPGTVLDNGQSSSSETLKLTSIVNGQEVDYVVVGYLAEGEQIPNLTSEYSTTILRNLNIVDNPLGNGRVITVSGDFSFLLNQNPPYPPEPPYSPIPPYPTDPC